MRTGILRSRLPALLLRTWPARVAPAAELTPENMELLASYSRPEGRAAWRPVVTSGDVLADGVAADAEQPGNGGNGVVRPGRWSAPPGQGYQGNMGPANDLGNG